MTQEVIINKILRDLKQFNLIKEDDSGIIKRHLEFLYGAAWNEGRKKTIYYSNKEVYQCDKEGHILATYKSATDAAKQLKCTRETIYLAISEKRLTRKGHYWKHKEAISEQQSQLQPL